MSFWLSIPSVSVHGAWSSWNVSDGDCVLSSGSWTKSKSRTCTNPAPSYGGSSCPGSETGQHVCPPENGSWSPWNIPEDNMDNCNQVGDSWVKKKTRTCDNPEPKYGGSCTDPSFNETTHPCSPGKLFCLIAQYWPY